MPAETIAQNLAFINWTVLTGLAVGFVLSRAVEDWWAVLGLLVVRPGALLMTTPVFGAAFADLLLLGGMGVLGVITQACYIRGMSEGDAAVMAPIDYTRLVFAVILGYALFQELPNRMTLLGATVIITSTVYITWREAQLGKPKLTPQRED